MMKITSEILNYIL